MMRREIYFKQAAELLKSQRHASGNGFLEFEKVSAGREVDWAYKFSVQLVGEDTISEFKVLVQERTFFAWLGHLRKSGIEEPNFLEDRSSLSEEYRQKNGWNFRVMSFVPYNHGPVRHDYPFAVEFWKTCSKQNRDVVQQTFADLFFKMHSSYQENCLEFNEGADAGKMYDDDLEFEPYEMSDKDRRTFFADPERVSQQP